jgi:hypothetical protein
MGHFLAEILGKLCADEVSAWLPWIALRITQMAVRTLPENQRERYDEEWRGHLNDVHGGALTKLGVACGFLCAAIKESPRLRMVAESSRRRIAEIASYGVVVLILPLFGMMYAIRALNSRRCYAVPLEVDIGTRDVEVTIEGIPLGLALRFALSPRISEQHINRSRFHYSIWSSSRLVELENFLWTRVLHTHLPFLSFGVEESPLPLSWGNIKFERTVPSSIASQQKRRQLLG